MWQVSRERERKILFPITEGRDACRIASASRMHMQDEGLPKRASFKLQRWRGRACQCQLEEEAGESLRGAYSKHPTQCVIKFRRILRFARIRQFPIT